MVKLYGIFPLQRGKENKRNAKDVLHHEARQTKSPSANREPKPIQNTVHGEFVREAYKKELLV